MSFERFIVYSLEEFHECACFAFDFGLCNCVSCRADVVCHYSFLFAVDDGIESAACGSSSVQTARVFLGAVEDAITFLVAQLGVSFLVHVCKLLSIASCFLEKSDVLFRQWHPCLSAADSALCTTHVFIVWNGVLICVSSWVADWVHPLRMRFRFKSSAHAMFFMDTVNVLLFP